MGQAQQVFETSGLADSIVSLCSGNWKQTPGRPAVHLAPKNLSLPPPRHTAQAGLFQIKPGIFRAAILSHPLSTQDTRALILGTPGEGWYPARLNEGRPTFLQSGLKSPNKS